MSRERLEQMTDAELGARWLERAGWRQDGARGTWMGRGHALEADVIVRNLAICLIVVVPEMQERGWEQMPTRTYWSWMRADNPSVLVPCVCVWSRPETVARAIVLSALMAMEVE